ncbi:MAG: PaaI family thioesterase, partial [Geodermatophilaceae bacterium]|nr:PaaI family thioesterase [Geodermatophilaceae bacterium]
FRCTPDQSVYNPIGLVHGGLVCTLLDSVLGCAVQTTLEAGVGYTSLEIKVSYLRPVRAGEGDLTAVGRVSRRGRRVSFADGEVRDSQGRLVATGSSTCLVVDLVR